MWFYTFFTALCIIASVLLLKTTTPYIWLSIVWIIFMLVWFFRTNKKIYKAILVYPIAILFTLGIFETYLWFQYRSSEKSQIRNEGSYTKGYFQDSDILGYAPQKNITVTSRKYNGNELIYDVSYNIKNGLRITPEATHHKDKNAACIVFFGGSFTFGEGVNDAQSMPYQVGLKSGYRTYNFGYHGYGPHQMLSALQHGLVKETADCLPTHIIYQGLTAHVARSAGHSSWDNGPKYILGEDGRPKFQGYFDNNNSFIKKILSKSLIFNKLNFNKITTDEKDVELFVQIVNSAREMSKQIFKESSFHVIMWDLTKSSSDIEIQLYNMIKKGFKKNHIRVHLISNILPEYYENYTKYQISPSYDGHPTYMAHNHISSYIVNVIIKNSTTN